jgi:hypothetical protein
VTANGVDSDEPMGMQLQRYRALIYACVVLMFSAAHYLVSCLAADIPNAVCDAPNFEFGTIDGGSSVKHQFAIRNAGRRELHILSAQSSCNCTIVDRHFNPTIAAGEVCEIGVSYTPSRHPGPHNQVVLIITDDPYHSRIWLHLQGESR